MAHEKVYGVCENKCKVEVLPLERSYGVSEVRTDTAEGSRIGGTLEADLPSNCVRHVVKNYGKVIYSGDDNLIKNGYNFQLVLHNDTGFPTNTSPASLVRVEVIINGTTWKRPIMFLNNPNFKLSDCTTAHFNFFFDGFNLCCRVEGYA